MQARIFTVQRRIHFFRARQYHAQQKQDKLFSDQRAKYRSSPLKCGFHASPNIQLEHTDLTAEEEEQMEVYKELKSYVDRKYPDKREWKELVEEYNPRPAFEEPRMYDFRELNRPLPPIHKVIVPLDVGEKFRVTRKTKWMIKQLRAPHINDVPSMLEQWVKTMYPKRSDWLDLLQEFQNEKDNHLMFQVFEFALFDDTFEVRSQDIEKIMVKYMNLSRYDDVERLMGMLDSRGFPPDFVVCTMLLDMYCNLKRLDKGREMYDRIRSLGFVPDVKGCTELINFYCISGNPEVGEMLLSEIEKEKVHGTIDTYLAVLKGYAKSRKVSEALRVFNLIKEDRFLRPHMGSSVYSAMMDAYTEVKMFPSSIRIFEDMLLESVTPDDRSVAFLITSLEKKNQFEKALDILLKLESQAMRPGVDTLATLISWFGKLGLVEEAEVLFQEIERKIDTPECNAHVNLYITYARKGMIDKARCIMDTMKTKKNMLNDKTFEQMIQALLDTKQLNEAQSMRDEMVAHGFTPSDEIERAFLGTQTDSLYTFSVPSEDQEKSESKHESLSAEEQGKLQVNNESLSSKDG